MADIVLIMPLANRFDKISPRVPSGLLAVAAMPDQAGYEVRIIDQKIDDHWRASLAAAIGPKTVCAGLTCSTGRMISGALEAAAEVRRLRPDLPIVWGGPHPTLVPEQTLEHPLVDFIVINEGDLSFLELVEALRHGRDVSRVRGVGYKRDGRPALTDPRPLIDDLDSLPPTPYHLVDVSRYSSLDVNGLPSLDVLTSRGCPFNCGFCSTPATSQRRWRPYSVDRVVAEVERLYREHGVRTFYFVDDNFMVDLRRVERILERIREQGMDIFWGTQGVRVDTINRMSPEFIDRLEASGCRELSVGVESGNPEILKMIDKRIRVQDALAANERLREHNFAVKYNMIIGFPGETMDQVRNTVKLALELYRRNKGAWFPFNIYTPFPATPMFEKAREHGFRAPERLEDWAGLESVGWERFYNHWLGHQENELLRSVNFTSYLAFPTARQKISNPLLRLLFDIYRPIAQFRFRHMCYILHLERRLMEWIEERRSPSGGAGSRPAENN